MSRTEISVKGIGKYSVIIGQCEAFPDGLTYNTTLLWHGPRKSLKDVAPATRRARVYAMQRTYMMRKLAEKREEGWNGSR